MCYRDRPCGVRKVPVARPLLITSHTQQTLDSHRSETGPTQSSTPSAADHSIRLTVCNRYQFCTVQYRTVTVPYQFCYRTRRPTVTNPRLAPHDTHLCCIVPTSSLRLLPGCQSLRLSFLSKQTLLQSCHCCLVSTAQLGRPRMVHS